MSEHQLYRLVPFASLLAVLACGGAVEPRAGEGHLVVRADLSGSTVATVVVEVTAPDIPTALVFNIPIVGRVASATITLPAGSGRTITMRAYDAGGVETHRGTVTVDVSAATNPTISMVLQPLTGDVPIVVTLGSFSVTVTPDANSITIGQTVQLTAVVKDWNGNPATGTVAWATSDPGIAFVDNSGLVTGTRAGTTTISATWHGTTGTAMMTVTPISGSSFAAYSATYNHHPSWVDNERPTLWTGIGP